MKQKALNIIQNTNINIEYKYVFKSLHLLQSN